MEAEVTAMASGSSSRAAFKELCITCGIHRLWTPRMWECFECSDYFLCEDCHEGSLEDSEVLSHNRDHYMSPHVTSFSCNACGSRPIWNLRWHCKVCVDLHLCELCYGGLDAADMPVGHSAEHAMIAVEVFCTKEYQHRPNFSKPADPQWSYMVDDDTVSYTFMWEKRKPLAKGLSTSHMNVAKDDAVIQISPQTYEDNNNHISQLEEQIDNTQQKHKIFLSHAGSNKDFVEQLNLDLSRVHHFGVFFDGDDESLPKGEPFPARIFDAAKHCELAIVVISDDYFVRRWPMLELATFVEAQKVQPKLKILPLFYKLTVREFKQPERQQSYVEHWKQFLGTSLNEGDIKNWKEALKLISFSNGLEYDRKMGEVTFRRKIVETVWKQVKPDVVWDDSHVHGKTHLYNTIHEKIQSSNNACANALFIGLYGMGGSGKTTMCKVIGNQMMEQYLGQVCHIEFGSMNMLQLLKKLLQCICSLESNFVMERDEGQALKLLKNHIPKHKVCLMIDNISIDQTSLEDAKTLLNLPFSKGSLILVTSRSRMILEKLKVQWGALMKIPFLTMDEAKALFMYHAGCDTSNLLEDQKKVMEKFLDRCNFKSMQRIDMVSREYLPLALKALGTRAGPNLEEWVNIDIGFKDYEIESKHHIFSILRLSYDTLIPQYKRMFLDIALSRINYFEGINVNGMIWQMRCLYDKNDKFVSTLVNDLQAKSLVEFFDAESGRIYIHDLYREFASMEVEKNEVKHSPCCCFFRASNQNRHLVQERRLRIHNQPISHITKNILSCTICSGVELFYIQGCSNLKSIDVPNMQNLKIFEVYGDCPKLRSVNLEGAVNLQCLGWVGFEREYPNLTSLESLEGLWLQSDEAQTPTTLHGCLDFSKNSKLEVLSLTYLPLNLLNLNQAVLLKKLYLWNCQHLERFEGLEALVHLEILDLRACCSLLVFPSLANFPSLEYFFLPGAVNLKQIDGFANLTTLQVISLKDGREIEDLPGIEACSKLSSLDLRGTSIKGCSWISLTALQVLSFKYGRTLEELNGIEACTELSWLDLRGTRIKDCSWISKMRNLTFINLSRTKIRVVPDCGDLYKLNQLCLDECQAMASIGNNIRSNYPSFPKSLKKFSAWGCHCLNAIPQFHYGSTLDYLNLDETNVDDVSSVIYCQQLQTLSCANTPITSLPDLSCLTRLVLLDVYGCEHLTRMDNIKSLVALEDLKVSGCASLFALPDLSSSTRLKALSLHGCPMVNPNLVKLPSRYIVDMHLPNNNKNMTMMGRM